MNISLSDTSGIEVMPNLRKVPKMAPISIIFLNAMPRDIGKWLEAGFLRYLTKRIRIIEFMNALDDALKLTSKKAINTNGQIK